MMRNNEIIVDNKFHLKKCRFTLMEHELPQ